MERDWRYGKHTIFCGEMPIGNRQGTTLDRISVSMWVKATGFDPKKGTLTTESKYWEVDANGAK
jgi:hypothetical protein